MKIDALQCTFSEIGAYFMKETWLNNQSFHVNQVQSTCFTVSNFKIKHKINQYTEQELCLVFFSYIKPSI